MRRYVVSLRRVETDEVGVWAESMQNAIEKSEIVRARVKEGYQVEGVETFDGDQSGVYMGRCESCSAVLLDCDGYVTTEDDAMICRACVPADTKKGE